jgi:putative tryptophan/tyrosine transport system substrate-binding protein
VILAAASWPALAWTPPTFGQAKKPPVVIGWLSPGTPDGAAARNLAAFKEGLAVLGWTEGTQFVIESRWAEGDFGRMRALAEELAKRRPAILLAGSASMAMLMAKAAPDVAIVQAGGTSPVQTGLAQSLARPGGMVTGITQLPVELNEKLVELLVEVAPN